MSFTILTAEQRSVEWFAARCGRLTGSQAADMLATIKKGEAAARRDLRTKLVVERLTGQPQEDGYTNAAMQRGIELEPAAIAAYETATGHIVRRTGFLSHATLLIGCSLDGDVDNFTGIVEVKCPKSATHLAYIKDPAALAQEYYAQGLHNVAVSGAQWCDFVSYDDRFPAHLRLVRHRIARNDFDVMAYLRTVETFLAEVDEEMRALRAEVA